MTISLFQPFGTTSAELYVHALSTLLKSGHRVIDPSFALGRDPEAYEKIMRDTVIAGAIERRLHAVAGKKFMMEPASDDDIDKEAAEVMTELLNKIRRFHNARFNLAGGVVRGSAYAFTEGRRKLLPIGRDRKMRNWWTPTNLVDIDKRRFRSVPLSRFGGPVEDRVQLQWELWSVARDRWERVTVPEQIIKHVYEDQESALGVGVGLIDKLYYYWYSKTIALTEGLNGLERWAQGIIVGSVDSDREASETKDNVTLRDALRDEIEKHRSRHILVKGKEETLEVVQGPGQGQQIVTDMINYLDTAMIILINGSNLPAMATKGGSFALAEVQQETSESIVEYDRELLSDTLTDELVRFVWNLNRANLSDLGLGKAQMPRLKITHEIVKDPTARVGVISAALNANIPLKKKEVYDDIGFTPPGPEDDVIEPKPVAPTIPGFK